MRRRISFGPQMLVTFRMRKSYYRTVVSRDVRKEKFFACTEHSAHPHTHTHMVTCVMIHEIWKLLLLFLLAANKYQTNIISSSKNQNKIDGIFRCTHTFLLRIIFQYLLARQLFDHYYYFVWRQTYKTIRKINTNIYWGSIVSARTAGWCLVAAAIIVMLSMIVITLFFFTHTKSKSRNAHAIHSTAFHCCCHWTDGTSNAIAGTQNHLIFFLLFCICSHFHRTSEKK